MSGYKERTRKRGTVFAEGFKKWERYGNKERGCQVRKKERRKFTTGAMSEKKCTREEI